MSLNKSVLLFFVLIPIFLMGQVDKESQIGLMQGIWSDTKNTESEKAFTIIKARKSINFAYNITITAMDFPLSESIEGFFDGDISLDTLFVDSLRDSGLHYVTVDKDDINAEGWVTRPDFLTPRYFECDGEIMSINGGQLVEYQKTNELPYEALDKLFKRGRLDKRDYILEYLSLKVRAIKSHCDVYSNPKEKANGKLEREQVVIILEENAKWLKVKYSEDGIGWIKKTHVEF
jgi:hypothetical protein